MYKRQDVHYRIIINEHHNNPSTPHHNNPNASQYPKPKSNNPNNNHGNKSKLPQTGESDESKIQLMGLVLLLISSVLSIFGFRKKQNK